jgi:M6 family metalloprotease-like protein
VIFHKQGPTGSVNEYFSEASNGAVNFDGEVVGPFPLSNRLSYYANRRKNNFSTCLRSED